MVDEPSEAVVESVAQSGVTTEVAAPAPSKWAKALVVAGGGAIPAGEKRGVVVCEVRADDGSDAQGIRYPQGADLYFRMTPATDFGPKSAGALTLGANVEQGLLQGFSVIPGIVNIGPAHPAYAAANLAALQGATEVEIQGLSALWKSRLQPWFDRLQTVPRGASTVSIKLT